MNNPETVVFPGTFDSLALIGEFFTRAAQAAGLDGRAVYSVALAVDEACSNIIEHAYGGEGIGPIECTYRIDENGLTVTLRDYGTPFDPSCVSEPDLESPLEKRDTGGLGMHFMCRMMDKVEFEFKVDTGNVLTMVKHRNKRS